MKSLLLFIVLLAFSYRIQSAPICGEYLVPLSEIEVGAYKEYGTKHPSIKIGIYHRTVKDIKYLKGNQRSRSVDLTNRPPFFQSFLLPPPDNLKWVASLLRSETKEYFIFIPHSEILEENKWCGIVHHPRVKPNNFIEPIFYEWLGKEWPGGFVNTCYGIGYDYAGNPVFSVKYDDEKLRSAARKFLVTPWHQHMDNKMKVVICKEPKNV